MKERKNTLIKYLRALEKEELIRFRSFLADTKFQSNTKNEKRKRLIRLLELIEKYALNKPKYTLAIQTKIYSELYADKEEIVEVMNPKRRNKLAANMTALTSLVERFLMYEALAEDEACQIKLLGNKLLDKNQFDLWNRFERKIENKLKEVEVPNLPNIEKKLQLEFMKLKYLENSGTIIKQDNLQGLTFLIDQYWLLKKFELHSTMQSLFNNNPTKNYADVAPLDTYFKLSTFYKEQSTITSDELIQRLYLNDISLKLLKKPSKELYDALLISLEKNKKILKQEEVSYFFAQANNFCVFKIKKGASIYKNKLLDNYKTMDAWEVLGKASNMQFNRLLNIVKLSCDNKDFDWAETMIDKYAPFISPKEQVSAKDLLYCAFYFYKGNSTTNPIDKEANYIKANEHIESVEKENIPLRLNYMTLRAKLLYEMDEQYNPYTVPNFKNIIIAIRKIKGLNENHKKFSINFIRILILLYEYKHKISHTTLDKIRAKMDKMKAKNMGISNEQWLLEKIEELRK